MGSSGLEGPSPVITGPAQEAEATWWPVLELTGPPTSPKMQGLLVPLTDASWTPGKLTGGWIHPSLQGPSPPNQPLQCYLETGGTSPLKTQLGMRTRCCSTGHMLGSELLVGKSEIQDLVFKRQ